MHLIGIFRGEYGRDDTVFAIASTVCILAAITAVVMYRFEKRIIEREGLRPYLEEISASMPGFGDEVYTHNQRVKEARQRFQKFERTRITATVIAVLSLYVAMGGWVFR